MEQGLNIKTEKKIIQRLKTLPPQKIEEVADFIDLMIEQGNKEKTRCQADQVKHSILELRGRGKGEYLTKRLLQSRREDKELYGRK